MNFAYVCEKNSKLKVSLCHSDEYNFIHCKQKQYSINNSFTPLFTIYLFIMHTYAKLKCVSVSLLRQHGGLDNILGLNKTKMCTESHIWALNWKTLLSKWVDK